MSRRVRPSKDINEPILFPPPPTRPFWREAIHAFIYPLAPRAVVVQGAAAVLLSFWSVGHTQFLWHLQMVRLAIITLLLGTFLIYCFFEVIQCSAGGRPKFPNLFVNSDFDWVESLLYGVEGVVISYLPTIAYLLVAFSTAAGISAAVSEAARALGCLYLPMALLSLAVWRDFAAVSPQYVLPAFRKVPGPTVLAAGLLWAASGLHLEVVRTALHGAPFGLVFFGNLAAIYLYFITARIIGITHWVYRNEIGWFPDRNATVEEG